MFSISEREKSTLPVSAILLMVAAFLRTQPHLSNTTPFFAISMLVGFILGRERAWLAAMMSLIAMLVGDLAIGLHDTMVFVYGGIALSTLIGAYSANHVLSRDSWIQRTFFASTTSAVASTIFFVMSNFGVWFVGGLYPKTAPGLVECFVLAIPFFTKSLGADIVFGTLFLLVASRVMSAQKSVAATAGQHGR